MKGFKTLVLFLLLVGVTSLTAQEDEVLFTVNDRAVTAQEFSYIYSKSNADESDFSETSLRDYLDLYINFKLKVEKARELGYDTLPKLQNELQGYYDQLSESYLIDNGVLDDLLKEAYQRKKEDVKIRHIFVRVDKTQSEEIALKKIKSAKVLLDKGEDFAAIAKKYSDDTYSKENGGLIGYLTAIFPMGFYDMETLAYQTPLGKISDIVRTPQGYHILLVEDKRPARGIMEIAHIFIAKAKGKDSKTKVEDVYQKIQSGALSFEDAAKQLSEDKKTGFKGGNLGFISINQYERAFEDAAFAITKDAAYSAPVESEYGWHIIKRISKKPFGNFDTEKNRLKAQIQRDSRFEKAKAALVGKIQKEYGFTENKANFDAYTSTLNKSFLDYKWKPKAIKNGAAEIFKIGDKSYNIESFAKFAKTALRTRAKGKNADLQEVTTAVYNEFVLTKSLDYEKGHLAAKYPVYKSLRREYEEGVYLFEIMKKEVWDKAATDTLGLQKYFDANRSKYMWGERAEVSKFVFKSDNEKLVKKFKKYVQKGKSLSYLTKKLNKNGDALKVAAITVEQKDLENYNIKAWKVGASSPIEETGKEGLLLYRLEKMIPPAQKELSEARGYIVADYQDFVEKEWLKALKADYPVVVNEKVLKSLVKVSKK